MAAGGAGVIPREPGGAGQGGTRTLPTAEAHLAEAAKEAVWVKWSAALEDEAIEAGGGGLRRG